MKSRWWILFACWACCVSSVMSQTNQASNLKIEVRNGLYHYTDTKSGRQGQQLQYTPKIRQEDFTSKIPALSALSKRLVNAGYSLMKGDGGLEVAKYHLTLEKSNEAYLYSFEAIYVNASKNDTVYLLRFYLNSTGCSYTFTNVIRFNGDEAKVMFSDVNPFSHDTFEADGIDNADGIIRGKNFINSYQPDPKLMFATTRWMQTCGNTDWNRSYKKLDTCAAFISCISCTLL